jgi:RNA polymerase sigma-70 factor (ECF subfamily)
VAAAIARDRGAFDALVAEHSSFLRQFVERRVPSARVDDLVQDVWVAAWTALPSFDRRSGFQTWLCAISLNKIRDFYRRERRLIPEVSFRESTLRLESPSLPDAVDTRDSVRALVARLTEKQREIIELYYCCEYTLPEIARTLDRNLNTVKYQFYAAHAELAEMLKKEGMP